MKKFHFASVLVVLLAYVHFESAAQQKISLGGRMGLSVGSPARASEAGFQIGPTFDIEFRRAMIAGSELNINTQTGTPIEWANYFKYLIDIPGSQARPYVDGGFNLWFVTGGPYFGLRFGGGAFFRIQPNLVVPADLQFGPIFVSGTTVFYIAFTSGIRYTLP